jgi:hypothetical protein
LNGKLENLLCDNGANLFGENKHTFCGGNEKGALLVASNGVSIAANAEIKLAKIHNTEVNKQVF